MVVPEKRPDEALARAVQDMLKAEMEFARAFEAWRHAPEPERKRALEAQELRLGEAMREAQRRQAHADDD